MRLTPGYNARSGAQLELRNRRIYKALADRVTELVDAGMTPFQILSITRLPHPLVNLILRGAPPKVLNETRGFSRRRCPRFVQAVALADTGQVHKSSVIHAKYRLKAQIQNTI